MRMMKYIILLATATVLMTACENVSVDERLIYVEPPEAGRAD